MQNLHRFSNVVPVRLSIERLASSPIKPFSQTLDFKIRGISLLHNSKWKKASNLAVTTTKSSSKSNNPSSKLTTSGKTHGLGAIADAKHHQPNGQKRTLAFASNLPKEKELSNSFDLKNHHQLERESKQTNITETRQESYEQLGLKSRRNKQLGRPYVSQQDINTNLVSSILESHDFVGRHIGPRDRDKKAMLNKVGYETIEELIEATVPDKIRLRRDLRLPKQLSEDELLIELEKLAKMNECVEWKSYIGMGYYDCITPSVIMRNMFENPGWTTAYTAYQAEIAQGRLESLMNYQTMVRDLTGMDIANASLLDEATAAAEAMQMCLRHHKSKRNKFLVSSRCHPQTIAVIKTRAEALQVDIETFDELNESYDGAHALADYDLNKFSGVIIQYPNTNGYLYDLDSITSSCQEARCLVVTATDLMALTLFKAPGDFSVPADITIGSSQRFGIPLNYGGPHAGFLACRKQFTRIMPGRVVGLTRDSNGDQAYRFALQTREQHIRRDKATSNICTAQALLANMSAMYAVYHGPKGLKEIATDIHRKTSILAKLINQQQQQVCSDELSLISHIVNDGRFFDTITIRCSDRASFELIKLRANEAKINLRYYTDQEHIGISLNETSKLSDLQSLARLFVSNNDTSTTFTNLDDGQDSQSSSSMLLGKFNDNQELPVKAALSNLERSSSFLSHPTFNEHCSEAQLVRYMKRLENKDISLVHSMIPLVSRSTTVYHEHDDGDMDVDD